MDVRGGAFDEPLGEQFGEGVLAAARHLEKIRHQFDRHLAQHVEREQQTVGTVPTEPLVQPACVHPLRRDAWVLGAQLRARDDASRRPLAQLDELSELLLVQRQATASERLGCEVGIPGQVVVGHHLDTLLGGAALQTARGTHHDGDVTAPPGQSGQVEQLDAIYEPPRILDHENGATTGIGDVGQVREHTQTAPQHLIGPVRGHAGVIPGDLPIGMPRHPGADGGA
ncbi:hypothetical protein GCM10025869_10220 [Homoserinibacter gongjuensis]|uniref:Uncharacterized protein n=1 Tax=Homoserinibacter gongjuensis TaxID=1162968 RepID=A0ABQ6JQE9_9MICO|nr:hypothetical protein GCM10025869_10220 [Homoserinibacter gongjuensis]